MDYYCALHMLFSDRENYTYNQFYYAATRLRREIQRKTFESILITNVEVMVIGDHINTMLFVRVSKNLSNAFLIFSHGFHLQQFSNIDTSKTGEKKTVPMLRCDWSSSTIASKLL